MKTLITLITLIACLFVGCGKSEISKEDLLKRSVVGNYEDLEHLSIAGDLVIQTNRLTFLENGKCESYISAGYWETPQTSVGVWNIVNGEIHVSDPESKEGEQLAWILQINEGGNLSLTTSFGHTEAAPDGSGGGYGRVDLPKDKQTTFKRKTN